ncbi:MAG: SDR family oxidoreductase [Chelatococcus sp.]|uniref:SDR family NAD(P)-dependent oxidoreductase n=1 Tax=Chelatococcus sp. TaxID=1953771 RepID=UPI0025C4B36D|nr:SDR family NAD(P)-dependent oxidoreductase [Chelatococcus sp.]MBX3538603.1 SDR family oxidoreductase [Chelatococcus sp.]
MSEEVGAVTETKTILVTGASSGLGESFARSLARDGHHIILAARRRDRIETIASDIAALGGSAEVVEIDVADAGSVANGVAAVSRKVDVVVNNAGITASKPAIAMEPAEFGAIIDTNLKGVFYVAQAAAKRMKDEGGGAIINIASILGLRVSGNVAAYAASKAGVVHLTKALALEWARYGIRVNALCPGYIETPLNAEFFASEPGLALIRRVPQRRLGTVQDLDAPLKMLCSDAAAHMTGSILTVDGGHLVSGL